MIKKMKERQGIYPVSPCVFPVLITLLGHLDGLDCAPVTPGSAVSLIGIMV